MYTGLPMKAIDQRKPRSSKTKEWLSELQCIHITKYVTKMKWVLYVLIWKNTHNTLSVKSPKLREALNTTA